jgi:hypothetical protein
MKTKIKYAVYDSRCIESAEDGICLVIEDTLEAARNVATDYGEGNCIYKQICEQNPKNKNSFYIKKETFVEQVYSQ